MQTDRPSFARRLFSRENAIAVALCLMALALIVFGSGESPAWIYQGF